MYAKCPKCGSDSVGQQACPRCGVIFAKYLKAVVGGAPARGAKPAAEPEGFRLGEWLFAVPDGANPGVVFARRPAGAHRRVRRPSFDAGYPVRRRWGSLMHYPIVPIHEFGHIVFMPFGEFMHNLGGTLFQVLLPLIFGGVLIVKNRDPFAASVMLWWAAVALIDAAPYVYDAYKPQHILLSGRTGDDGSHDFVDVLGDLGLLNKAQPIGYGVRVFGVGMLVLALAWGAYVLWLQYRETQRSRPSTR